MFTKKIGTILIDKGDIVFFLLAAFYQILFIFQGLDLSDEGFYATFYQQIFNDPQSVAFNFMYWLTGILGGAWYYVFPHLGLLGFRILGVIVTSATLILTYYALKNYIPKFNLRIGLTMVLLYISNNPKEMYYNNLSALFYILSAILLFFGLIQPKYYKIALSGAFISLSMFSRIPSASGLIFIVAIIYYGLLTKANLSAQLKQIARFVSGFLLMTAAILLIMIVIGHWKIFIDNLNIVWGMGFDNDGSNNIFKLSKLFIKSYSNSIILGITILTLLLIVISIFESSIFLKRKKKKIYFLSFSIISITILLELLLKKVVSYSNFQMSITGLCIVASALILINSKHKELKLYSLLGVLILLIHPFGSESGQISAGRYSLWIILPITLDFISKIDHFQFRTTIFQKNLAKNFDFIVHVETIKFMKLYFLLIFFLSSLFFAYFYPFCDKNDRRQMYFQVNNQLVSKIYTTKERATAINELLVEAKKYIKQNDILFAYDNIPMIHFLTSTRPFLRNPWPGYYYAEAFQYELNRASNHAKKLPVVITEKVNKTGQEKSIEQVIQISWSPIDPARDSIMNNFLKNFNYHKIWENRAFEILIPDNKNPKDTENRN